MIFTTIFLLQFLIGFGLVDRFGVINKLGQKISLSILLGFFVSSVAVFALELLHIKLTTFSILSVLALAALIINFNLPHLLNRLLGAFTENRDTVQVYELVFFLAAGYLLFYSVWRSYSIPVTPYDSIVGIDLVAKQAIKEGHIVSSIFYRPEFRPYLSTQPYYAPFTMLMQVIYRFAGLPFGQLWLGILTVSFFVFAYSKLCEKIHPVIAGFFVLLFITVPEMYAYTFLLQTDFSNAVFFSVGMIFTIEFLESKNIRYLFPAAVFMAAACWSRTETIILVIPVASIILVRLSSGRSFKLILPAFFYFGFCALFNVLWNVIFFKLYFPVVPEVKDQINWKGVYSWEKSSEILNGMNAFFFNANYWGYSIHIFLTLWLINMIFSRSKKVMSNLAWIALFYLCFFVMLHHFTLMNIEYTFRRAVMKFLLLMCLLMSRFPLLQRRIALPKIKSTNES
ncbi:MAG: hypothetical protein ABIN80_19175 [Dyadobacter sp.]|uniref:hypothetical protein n=1 Tax=Dyadobacter sp. TaxID=1914288 RepID=UPI0032679AD7